MLRLRRYWPSIWFWLFLVIFAALLVAGGLLTTGLEAGTARLEAGRGQSSLSDFFSWQPVLQSLWASMTTIISPAVYVVVLVLFGLADYLTFKAGEISQELELAAAQIRAFGERNETLTSSSITAVEAMIPDLPGLTAQWAEFREALVLEDGRLHNAHPIGSFIKNETVLDAKVGPDRWHPSLSRAEILPNLMTGLGMLGTFLGIAAGLGAIRPDSGADVPRQVELVVIGLSSAFWTSIFGLVAAFIANWRSRGGETRVIAAIELFREAIDRLVPRLVAESLHIDQRAAAREMQGSLAQVVRLMTDFPESTAKALTTAIQDQVVPKLQEMNELVRDQSTKVTKESIKNAKLFTEQLVKHLVSSLQHSLAEFSNEISQFSTKFHESSIRMQELLNDVTEITKVQRQFLVENNLAFDRNHKTSLSTAEAQTKTSEIVERGYSNLLKNLGDRQREFTDLQQAQTQFIKQATEMMATLVTQLGQSTQSYAATATDFAALLPQLQQGQQQLATNVGGLGETLERASNTLGQSSTKLEQVHQQAQRTIAAEAQLLAGQQKALAGLHSATEEELALLQRLQTASQQIAEQQQPILRLLDLVARAESSLLATNQELGQGATTTLTAIRQINAQLQQGAAQLQDWEQEQRTVQSRLLTGVQLLTRQATSDLSHWQQATSQALSEFSWQLARSVGQGSAPAAPPAPLDERQPKPGVATV